MAQNKKKAKAKAKAKPAPKKKIVKKAVKTAKAVAKRPAPSAKPVKAAKINFSLIPLDDRVLVAAEGPSETTAGGIIIPGNAAQRPNRGRVLAAGRGKRNKKGQVRPLDVNVGDMVLYPEFSGTAITLNGEEFLILREEEVLGVTK